MYIVPVPLRIRANLLSGAHNSLIFAATADYKVHAVMLGV